MDELDLLGGGGTLGVIWRMDPKFRNPLLIKRL